MGLVGLLAVRTFWLKHASATRTTQWHVHTLMHAYWKDKVFSSFGVRNIPEVLNLEPSIDHFDHYKTRIPEYFKSDVTTSWIDEHYEYLDADQQEAAKQMLTEAASIMAAHAMCHPRDRVGMFDWSDVTRLHEELRTPYTTLIPKYLHNKI